MNSQPWLVLVTDGWRWQVFGPYRSQATAETMRHSRVPQHLKSFTLQMGAEFVDFECPQSANLSAAVESAP